MKYQFLLEIAKRAKVLILIELWKLTNLQFMAYQLEFPTESYWPPIIITKK